MIKEYRCSALYNGETFEEQLQECREEIDQILNNKNYNILKVCFFVNSENPNMFLKCTKLVQNIMNETARVLVPYEIIAQPPIENKVSMEICYLDVSRYDSLCITYKKFEEIRYCILANEDEKEVICPGITFYTKGVNLSSQLKQCYETMEQILLNENMDFSNVIRQWNYLEGILDIIKIDNKSIQRYQMLNEIREEFYSKCKFVNGYPSATGIGMNYGGFVLGFIASSLNTGVYPITNVEQIDAHRYSEHVLAGEQIKELSTKATPKFERAKLVLSDKSSELYISGTASIKGEETIGVDDVLEQTKIIFSNIRMLVEQQYKDSNSGKEMKYKAIRIYIKERDLVIKVKKLVQEEFLLKNALIFLIADICRDNLLIEIEGICQP